MLLDDAGQYTQPEPRRTSAIIPVLTQGTASTTLRLRAVPFAPTVASGAIPTQMLLRNIGVTAVTVDVMQTTSSNAASGRQVLAGAVSVPPRGQKTVNVSPYMEYMEVWNHGTISKGRLRVDIESRIQWEQMAFDRADPTYPQVLDAQVIPPLSTLDNNNYNAVNLPTYD